MGLELSEAVNKEEKKRKRETGGKRQRPDSPLQVVGEKGSLQVGSYFPFLTSWECVGFGMGLGMVFSPKCWCAWAVCCLCAGVGGCLHPVNCCFRGLNIASTCGHIHVSVCTLRCVRARARTRARDKQASLWARLLSPEPGEQISNDHNNNK